MFCWMPHALAPACWRKTQQPRRTSRRRTSATARSCKRSSSLQPLTRSTPTARQGVTLSTRPAPLWWTRTRRWWTMPCASVTSSWWRQVLTLGARALSSTVRSASTRCVGRGAGRGLVSSSSSACLLACMCALTDASTPAVSREDPTLLPSHAQHGWLLRGKAQKVLQRGRLKTRA